MAYPILNNAQSRFKRNAVGVSQNPKPLRKKEKKKIEKERVRRSRFATLQSKNSCSSLCSALRVPAATINQNQLYV